MIQEDRQLLLADLCARLPYGVKVHCESDCGAQIAEYDLTLTTKDSLEDFMDEDENCKPYLRPMSSMTEEEKKDALEKDIAFIDSGTHDGIRYGGETIQFIYGIDTFDWLNAHHFDVRNLIGRGLAIE